MPSVAEAAAAPGQLGAALQAGVNQLAGPQQVTFQQYVKSTVPTDGYVFWVASGAILTVSGSVHYGTDRRQEESETLAVNRVDFTAEQEITQFNQIAPNVLWVGTITTGLGTQDSVNLRFAFSARSSLYFRANLWHYVGDAVYPALASQLIASPSDLPAAPIVSNSLPIWLAQNSFAPVYPSFLVPDNIVPPYITAHVEPDQTGALQAFPLLTGWPAPPIPLNPTLYQLTSEQLCRDRVRLTLYGFNNQTALQFLVSLIEYSQNTDAFGFMNSPAVIDDKRTQREMAVIAMRKRIEIDASYYQSTADALARRLIVSAPVTTSVVNP